MARYSVREGRGDRRRRNRPPADPVVPDERQWRTELPSGLVRIDMGEPIPRLACEPQPVAIAAPEVAPAEPESVPSEAEEFAAMLPRDLPPRDWRRDYGLAKL